MKTLITGALPHSPKKIKAIAFLVLGLIILGSFFALRFSFNRFGLYDLRNEFPRDFTLFSPTKDVAGMDPDGYFIFQSKKKISLSKVKESLHFEPKIEFDIEQVAAKHWGIDEAHAASGDTVADAYRLVPQKKLAINTIYKAAFTDTENKQEYAWAFQTKAEFQVIATHPAPEGVHVPTNSGIEIVFNRENFENPEQHFSIEPKIEGRFEQYNNKLVFLPKDILNEKTIYTVTVGANLSPQESDETLGADFTFRFETSDEGYLDEAPYFYFHGNFLNHIPNDAPIFPVNTDNTEKSLLTINVYKFPSFDEFYNTHAQEYISPQSWTYYYRRNNPAYTPNDQDKILSFQPEIIKENYQEYVQLPQGFEAGYYFIEALVEQQRSYAWLQINPLSEYFSVTNNQSIVWVYDFPSKQPSNGVKITVLTGIDNRFVGSTNEKGLLTFETPSVLRYDNEEPSGYEFFKIEREGTPTKLVVATQAFTGDEYWDFLSTDRYSYHLNDTVHFWGILKGREQDLRNKQLKVTLAEGYAYFDGGYDRFAYADSYLSQFYIQKDHILETPVSISSFDTYSGSLSFEGLNPGTYQISLMDDEEQIASTSVRIFSFEKPLYQFSITPDKKALFTGETVNFDIEATFFDGTPVPNMELTYSGWWNGSITGQLQLDRNGKGKITYTPAYNSEQYYPQSLSISISPKNAEEGEITGEAATLVFGPNLYLQTRHTGDKNNKYTFTAKANAIVINNTPSTDERYWDEEYLGAPISGQTITAKVVKITHKKIESGQYYDYINKVVRKNYNYVTEEAIIETISSTTDTNGEWTFTRTLPSEKDIQWRIDFSTQAPNGRVVKDSSYAYFYDYSPSSDFGISLHTADDNKEYSIGDTIDMKLDVSNGEIPAQQDILYYRFQNNIKQTYLTPQRTLRETFTAEMVPSQQFRAVVMGPYGFVESNDVWLNFKTNDRRLSLDISRDKEEYRPGEEVRLDIGVKDKNGTPTRSEVQVSVVDEAIFHILPFDFKTDILEELYQRVWNPPQTVHADYQSLRAEDALGLNDFSKESMLSLGAEKGGCFTGSTLILMADGSSKPIDEVFAGDQILTRTSENDSTLAVATVQGRAVYTTPGYMRINHELEVTPEHTVFVNNSWKYASSLHRGDVMIGTTGLPLVVEEIEIIPAPKTKVYNLIVGNYHTYFADGYYVHNEQKGGTPRENFLDTAFFQSVQTSDDGKAQVSFKSPDNITSWRATVRAYNPDQIQAGQEVELVPTTLPFFIEATLNNTYLLGDQPNMRVRFFGREYIQQAQTEFFIESKTLGISKELTTSENTLFFAFDPLVEGEHELILRARHGSHEDALKRIIKVVPNYFRKAQTSEYQLTNGQMQFEKNEKGTTELIFTPAGLAKYYNPLQWRTYIFGIRLDQELAAYRSHKLLEQYFTQEPTELTFSISDYQRGGLSLFPYSDDDLTLSAMAADIAPELVSQQQLSNYFESALDNKAADIHRISIALYGLASLEMPVLTKLQMVQNYPDLTFEDRVYVALGLAKLGDLEAAREIYTQKIRPELKFQADEAWLSNIEDSNRRNLQTALVAMLSAHIDGPDTEELYAYIQRHDPDKDLDTLQETIVVTKLLEDADAAAPRFTYSTNTRSEDVDLSEGWSHSIELYRSELDTLTFSNVSGDITMISFYENSAARNEFTTSSDLSISRTYSQNGKVTERLTEGEIVKITLTPKFDSDIIDGRYQIIDFLPSGLKPIANHYGGYEPYTYDPCDPTWYAHKIIENSVYFSVSNTFQEDDEKCAERTLHYYARVVSTGTYKANSAIIQSTKDFELLNLSNEQTLVIE